MRAAAAPTPATSTRPGVGLVAGLDLLTLRERDADRLAFAVAQALVADEREGATVATHWARVGDLRHVALSIEAPGGDAEILWAVLRDQARLVTEDAFGLVIADRYHGPAALRTPTEAAAAAHVMRSTGRVPVFPGSTQLTGTMLVGDVVAASAIDRVRVLAGGEADPSTMLVTRDFVRPRWTDGQLVLDTQPAAGNTLVPFETPRPTPCCADHA